MDDKRSAPRLQEVKTDEACPLCGSDGVEVFPHSLVFTYGSDDDAADLTVEVSVRRCDACGFEYLDESAEDLKHEAVCRHLGLLSPGDIRGIRKKCRMSRSTFARLTGLGDASLNRWENGLRIQSRANDRYLRLLAFPDVMRRLEAMAVASSPPRAKRFRSLDVTDDVRRESNVFRLRRAA